MSTTPPPPGKKKSPETETEAAPAEVRPFARIDVKYVRKVGQVPPEPDTDDDGHTWKLRFAPKDGATRRLTPGERAWLETGVVLKVPPGHVAQVSYLAYNGRPGLFVPAIELTAEAEETELLVPVRNETEQAVQARPGDFFFRLRLVAAARALILPAGK